MTAAVTLAGADGIVAMLEALAAVLASKGLNTTSHLLGMTILDLKCQLNGISEAELASILEALRAGHDDESGNNLFFLSMELH